MTTPWEAQGVKRRLVEKLRYEKMAAHYAHLPKLCFMNFGYLDTTETPVALAPGDDDNRLYAQLYERVTRPVVLEDRDILEVGCGRGGGASFLARSRKPRKYVGLDLTASIIEQDRQWHAGIDNLTFQQGDAEQLPFEDASFDVVVNIESSHGYGSVARFLASVARVLRPGGHLAFADVRPFSEVLPTKARFAEAGLDTLEEQDITPFVLASLTSSAGQRIQVMLREVVPGEHARFLEAGAFPGSATYECLRSGVYRYLRFCLRKP